MKRQEKSEHYQKIIDSMDELTSRIDSIAQDYFEANINFMSKVDRNSMERYGRADERLVNYDKRFKDLLKELEHENKLLKREKINLQFRKNLLSADETTSLI